MLKRLLPALTGIWIMLCAVLPFYPFEPANKSLQAHPSVIVFGMLASLSALYVTFRPESARRIALLIACSWIGTGVTLLLANVVIAGGITIVLGGRYTLDYLWPMREKLIHTHLVDNPAEPCELTVDKSS